MICSFSHCISKRQSKVTKFLSNYLKDQDIVMNIKQKMRIKIRETSIDIFSNQTF